MVTKGGCSGWLQQRTNLEKTLLSLSCILILTLVLLILVGIAFQGKSSDASDSKENLGCLNAECIKTAGHILSLMDEKWDPCSNFYDYACGSFNEASGHSIAQNSIDSVYYSIKDLLESSPDTDNLANLKSFYRSCMEFDGLHSKRQDTSKLFLDLMERFGIGTWPVLDDYYEAKLSLAEVLSALTLVGVPVAFRVEVVPDMQIEGSYLLKISPGGPLESGRTAIDIRSDQDLRTYMLFSFLLLGTSTYSKSTRAVDDILSVDAYYAHVEQDTVRKCDTVDILTPDESLNRLNNMIPEMEWTVLFTSIQKEAGLKRPFAVELHCKEKIRDYLIHLNDLVDVISHNYFGWCFFESFAKHVEPSLRRARSHTEATDDVPRWKECVMLIEKHAAPLLTHSLSSRLMEKETEEKVADLTKHFQSSAEQVVSKSRWLQGEKPKILRQIKSIHFQYPFLKRDAGNATQSLQLPEVNNENYTAAVVELRRQSVIQNFKKLNPSTETDRTNSWDTLLTSASHVPRESSLPIYFDKVQEPYLRLYGSKSLNYGGFSTSIAREWSETFVTKGMGSSMVWNLWSNNRNGSSCLANLLSEHFGLKTENEREKYLKDLFLDIGSLEIAFKSVKSGTKSQKRDLLPGFERSDEQMFFLAYAQTQCASKSREDPTLIPVRERVNTILSNSKEFKEAFSCSIPKSSKRCEVWT